MSAAAGEGAARARLHPHVKGSGAGMERERDRGVQRTGAVWCAVRCVSDELLVSLILRKVWSNGKTSAPCIDLATPKASVRLVRPVLSLRDALSAVRKAAVGEDKSRRIVQ